MNFTEISQHIVGGISIAIMVAIGIGVVARILNEIVYQCARRWRSK